MQHWRCNQQFITGLFLRHFPRHTSSLNILMLFTWSYWRFNKRFSDNKGASHPFPEVFLNNLLTSVTRSCNYTYASRTNNWACMNRQWKFHDCYLTNNNFKKCVKNNALLILEVLNIGVGASLFLGFLLTLPIILEPLVLTYSTLLLFSNSTDFSR